MGLVNFCVIHIHAIRIAEVAILGLLLCDFVDGGSIQLNEGNLEDTLESNDIVFINFYADWCRFSQMLEPVFDAAADKIASEFPKGRAVFGKVDCDRQTGIASRYHVTKYPTLKVFRYGSLVKREYRGQRSADALSNFVREQLKNSVQDVKSVEDLNKLDRNKRHVIGYFDNKNGPGYQTYMKVANQLKDDCNFHAVVGQVSEREHTAGSKIAFRPKSEGQPDIPYSGPLDDYHTLYTWANDRCVPLVREITFENAEELTEEGLPFLILFHDPADKETPEVYSKQVAKELMHERSNVNFLTANGLKFSHPLQHLGKSISDLPLIAIDSFRHMYLFPHDAKTDMTRTGVLTKFIADLHSGKLHREFHHGPDPVEQNTNDPPKDNQPVDNKPQDNPPEDNQAQVEQTQDGKIQDNQPEVDVQPQDTHQQPEAQPQDNQPVVDDQLQNTDTPPQAYQPQGIQPQAKMPEVEQPRDDQRPSQHIPHDSTEKQKKPKPPTNPPESIFKKLAPSRNRYTLLRDEL